MKGFPKICALSCSAVLASIWPFYAFDFLHWAQFAWLYIMLALWAYAINYLYGGDK